MYSPVNGANTFSLLHFCKQKSENVKKLTLFVLWNACKITAFFFYSFFYIFENTAESKFWGNFRLLVRFCNYPFLASSSPSSSKHVSCRFPDVVRSCSRRPTLGRSMTILCWGDRSCCHTLRACGRHWYAGTTLRLVGAEEVSRAMFARLCHV
jgi:hypothetical protein